jgi:hypothetical protein
MRLSLIIFPLLFLPALPAAAGWERLRPETEAPPVLAPAPDAVCREKARSIDERLRWGETAAQAAGGAAEVWIPEDAWTDRQWFWRRCFRPRLCPAAGAPASRLRNGTVTGPYERLLELCGQPDGQR